MADTASFAAGSAPVMDVVAPPVDKADKKEASVAETDPLDQLVADDQRAQEASAMQEPKEQPELAAKAQKSARREATHRPTESTQHGVGTAIAATVIIVLSLAALATYAYLQTNT